jgi:hypothetical protein
MINNLRLKLAKWICPPTAVVVERKRIYDATSKRPRKGLDARPASVDTDKPMTPEENQEWRKWID